MQLSEALQSLKIIVQDRTLYSGRAVVSNIMHTGTLVVVEVKLREVRPTAPASFCILHCSFPLSRCVP